MQKVERDNSQGYCHRVTVPGKGVNEGKRQKIENERGNRSDNIRAEKQVDEEESKNIGRQPKAEKCGFIGQNVKAEQLQKSPNIVMKQRLSRNNNMEPGWLIWMTDNISFQVPEIPAGLVKKRVSVPRGGAEIPEVRNYKKQD